MRFEAPLVRGTLLRRYKRFLADVRLAGGEEVTAHVANTGSMLGCAEPGSAVALSHHPGRGRRLPWSWQLVGVGGGWACVNTSLPNAIVAEALAKGRIGPLRGYDAVRREVPYGTSSRIDLLLSRGRDRCYVEVKNVTLRGRGRQALFPDAVTARGTKHVQELARVAGRGCRAVLLFVLNRTDCASVAPAREIDPAYAAALEEAVRAGVELLAYRTHIDLEEIRIDRKVPVRI